MKQTLLIFIVTLFCAATTSAQVQPVRNFSEKAFIAPYGVQAGYYKTTVLVFPAAISPNGVDRGSADIIAAPVEGVSNILKLKANKEGFSETNLTVVTADGRVYPFRVNYSDDPPDHPIDLRKQKKEEEALALFNNPRLNEEQLEKLSEQVAHRKPFMGKRKARANRIKMKLEGIYICRNVIFYRFQIKNRSRIDYDMDFSRFYVRDRKRVKRTAEQEKELNPIWIHYDKGPTVAGKTSNTLVVAFPKFTIADKKNFVIQLFEKNGDRHLTLKANGNDIVSAESLGLPQ